MSGSRSAPPPGQEIHEPFAPLEVNASAMHPPIVKRPTNGNAHSSHSSHRSHELARRIGHEQHHDCDLHAGAEPGVNPRSGAAIAEFSHFKQDCIVDVIDYDCDDVNSRRYDNSAFISLLKERGVRDSPDDESASLPPRMVRWINIGGIDWDVLSSIALKYNLHSLALEDILHERGHNHSKADYYPGHLFLRILCHTLDAESNHSNDPTPEDASTALSKADPRQESEELLHNQPTLDLEGGGNLDQGLQKVISDDTTASTQVSRGSNLNAEQRHGLTNMLPYSSLRKRWTGLSGFSGPARERRRLEIEALKEGDRVVVKHQPMFIFLLTDGTVISLHPAPNLDYTSPITERLHRSDSVLRTSEDASLLVESLLDLVVDRVLEVVDEYQTKISQLERDILLYPVMKSVRSLHILSGDLILHKRTLDPIRTMVNGLRRYDLERCRAVADNVAAENRYLDTDSESTVEVDGDDDGGGGGGKGPKKNRTAPLDHNTKAKARRKRQRKRAIQRAERTRPVHDHGGPREHQEDSQERFWDDAGVDPTRGPQRIYERPVRTQNHQVEGFFSYKAKVYLADVNDHMDFALTSLDMFAGITENLINYAFNTASYEMNIVMNRLTLVTIIFLPLTLMTGYFGMNFTWFWSINNNSDLFFWEIALPMMAVLIPIFMFAEIRKAFGYLKRRSESHKAVMRVQKKWQ